MTKMTVVYALEEPPETYCKSIFLAGPTPRSADVKSWRPEALENLLSSGYDGVVFVPEDRSGVFHGDYLGQLDWEDRCLNLADCILFWIPRDMTTLPGLTTNHELGRWEDSGKIVFGAPEDAQHVRYQWHYASKAVAPTADMLSGVCKKAMQMVERDAERSGAERDVPLHIWHTASFQQWYTNLKAAGNRLDGAKVEWIFRVGPTKNIVFAWVMHVNVYVASEDRNKINEVVVARSDTSAILLFQRKPELADSAVVLVREFRSPVNNPMGFVWELPAGSSHKPDLDPREVAAGECYEETGLLLPSERFSFHETRQLAATFSTHRSHLFSAEITDDELAFLQSQAGIPHTLEGDSEQTYVEITTLGEIRAQSLVDWTTLGMILQIIL